MIRFFIFSIIMFFANLSFATKPLITDLSLRTIEIDSRFTGSEILFFGARNDAGTIVLMVKGPKEKYIVRKKSRKFGIWVNSKQLEIDNANGIYAIATSRNLDKVNNNHLLSQLGIGIDNIKFYSNLKNLSNKDEFAQAFIEQKKQNNLYDVEIGEISLLGDTLFRSVIKFPEKISRGTYTIEAYLFSNGQLRAMQSIPLEVKKKGIDAFIFDLAYNHAAIYGLVAVFIALLSGWTASIVFRKVVQ